MSDIFFTSDLHFGHANIIKYCNRPFANTDEMDEALIKNWNSKIKPNDNVYFMGDFSFNNPTNYLRRLNGKIFFIRGNHDHSSEDYFRAGGRNGVPNFQWMKDVHTVVWKGQRIWLSHYAHRVWPQSHRATWHLYGHSHGTLPDDPTSLSFDCGVDCHNYMPLSFEEVQEIMLKKHYTPVDHHGRTE